jgi:amidase
MHKLERTNPRYYLDPNHTPAISVMSGDEVLVDLHDTYTGQIQSEQDIRTKIDPTKLTPLTGPIYVIDAEPGNTLSVLIEDISVSDIGIMPVAPGLGVIGRQVSEVSTKIFKIIGDHAVFSKSIHLPLKPMIGTIGVAPRGDRVRAFTPGDFGGNMDLRAIRAGTEVNLPVFVPGALLYLGDLHGLQGDGELSGTGLEVAGSVTIKVSLIEGKSINRPRIFTEDCLMFVSSNRTLDQATEIVVSDAVQYLVDEFGLNFADAYRLVSLVGDLSICQVVNPKVTVRLELPRRLLSNL